MNIKIVLKTLGRLLILEAVLMILPIIVSIVYGENISDTLAFLYTIIILLVIGFSLNSIKQNLKGVFASEGLVIVILAWILLSFFGSFPLFIGGSYDGIIDSFFEVSSGFTTTGASVLNDVSNLPYSIIFWKAIIQGIGGMGVLVFALAILPSVSKEDVHLMKAEVPGPVFGKFVSRLSDTARILYKIYISFIVLLIVALVIAGMPIFDSIVHALETAGTGGFSVRNGSIEFYNNEAIEYIIAIAMLVFSVNFSLYHLILIGKTKEFFKSEELKWFLSIVFIAIVLLTINLYSIYGLKDSIRYAFFQVSTIISTTGFTSTDYGTWPVFSQTILIILMIIGGMSGSTAGGIKVSRLATVVKSSINEIKQSNNPKRVLQLKFEGKVINNDYIKTISNYLTLYTIIFVFLLLCVSFDLNDFSSSFSAVAATFNNIGPGVGLVGPTESFGILSDYNKVLLSLAMIAGRLEIIPMVVLFSIDTWKKV